MYEKLIGLLFFRSVKFLR